MSEIIYEMRFRDPRLPEAGQLMKKGFGTFGQADIAAKMASLTYGHAAMAKIKLPEEEGGAETLLERMNFIDGEAIDHESEGFEQKRDAAITAALKKLKAIKPIEKENTMTSSDMNSAELSAATKGKPVTKAPPVAAKGAGKAAQKAGTKAKKAVTEAKPPKKAAADGKAVKAPSPKAKRQPAETVGKPGSLLHSFGLRAGTARAGMVTLFAENIGKLLPIKDVLKATYGKADLEKIGALQMVIAGTKEMIKMNKIDVHIARGEDAKGDLTLGLKKGKAE